MKLKYLAHASFLITSDSGIRIVTDPYTPDKRLRYAPVNEPADIVTVSHDHGDHNAVSTVPGNPDAICTPGITSSTRTFLMEGLAEFSRDTLQPVQEDAASQTTGTS